MIKIKRIDHVSVAVHDIDEAVKPYRELLGLEIGEREFVEGQKVDAAMLHIANASIELIAPKGGNPGLEKFLAKRGPGIHHIAIEVEGIGEALGFLKSLGVALIDEVPRRGISGHQVAFIHPKATGGVLVELVEMGNHEG